MYHRYFSWKSIRNLRIQKVKKQPEQSFSLRPLKDALHPSQSEDGGKVKQRLRHLCIFICLLGR